MRRISALAMIALFATGLGFGQARRFQISLFGGIDRVMAYGSEGDYAMGSNDFPVTPAHTPKRFGAALAYSLSERLRVELRGEYTLAADLNLVDPSDQDTVTISSAKHLSFSLNLLWELTGGRLRPYLIAGGGIDKIPAASVSAISAYGYEVSFVAPSRTLDYFLNGGAGLRWSFLSSLGLFMEARYRYLFASPRAIQSLSGTGGFSLRF